jgi:hypothetical protein
LQEVFFVKLSELKKISQLAQMTNANQFPHHLQEIIQNMGMEPSSFYQELEMDSPYVDTYRDILDLLKQEKLVLFFSEGRLNFKDNQVQDYKMGTAFFAAMSGAPVVPVYIVRREKFLQRTHIIVGQKILFQDVCSGMPSIPEIEKFNAYIREQECTLEKWYHEHMGK